MKTLDPALQTVLEADVTTLCYLWRLELVDGSVLKFTDHDKDVGDYSSNKSFSATAVQTTLSGAKANLDVAVLLDDGVIDYKGLQRGKYDQTRVFLSLADFTNPASALLLYSGVFGAVTLPSKLGATISLVGNLSRVTKDLTEQYSLKCRADFGDHRCKVDLDDYSVPFSVSAVNSAQNITLNITPVAGLYDFGVIAWTTGENAGMAVEILQVTIGGVARLMFKTAMPIQVGDTGTVYQGCKKTTAACTVYNNLPNFRGEPFVPGDEYTGV